MLLLLWLAIGILLAIPFILAARSRGTEREPMILALGLIGAAIIYLGFAIAWGNAIWLAIEVGGLVVYGFFVLLAWRHAVIWLAVGWAAHPFWDLVLHWVGPGQHIAPAWYVFACLSFDLLLAGYIVFRLNQWQDLSPRLSFGRI